MVLPRLIRPRGHFPRLPPWRQVRAFETSRTPSWRARRRFRFPRARALRNRFRARVLRAVAQRTAPGIASIVAGYLGHGF